MIKKLNNFRFGRQVVPIELKVTNPVLLAFVPLAQR